MSKQNELVKNTAIITFGKICTQLVSFFLLPLYTAVLSTAEYGVVDLVLTYSSFLLPFVTLALEQGLFRFLIDVRNDPQKISEYISTVVFTSLLFCTVIFIALWIMSIWLGNKLFCYFGLVLLGATAASISLQIMRGLGDNIGYTVASTLTGVIQVVSNVLFLTVFKMGAYGMMLATVMGSVVCAAFAFARCSLQKILKISSISRSAFRELAKYSFPLIPNQLSWWALNASDKVIVQFFIGVAGNGLIAVANKFSGMYISFSNIFNISWTESATLHINDNDAPTFFNKTINSVYRLFLCACCGIIVCMPFVFPIMVNIQYSDAYGLIPIFLVASLCNVVVSLYGVIYVAYKKTIEIAKTAVYAALLNIISHLLLIHFVGIYAAALSTLIGYGGMAIYRYFHSRKYLVIKFDATTLAFSIILVVVSFVSYYSNNMYFQIAAFFFVAFVSFLLNKETLSGLVASVMKKLVVKWII